MQGIKISEEQIKDILTMYLDREPPNKEVEYFTDYLQNNVPHWLVGNAQIWVKEVKDSES